MVLREDCVVFKLETRYLVTYGANGRPHDVSSSFAVPQRRRFKLETPHVVPYRGGGGGCQLRGDEVWKRDARISASNRLRADSGSGIRKLDRRYTAIEWDQ